jgi:hypothetical protein
MNNLNKTSFTYTNVNAVALKKVIGAGLCSFRKKIVLLAVSLVFSLEYGICQQNTPIQKGNFGLAALSIADADGYGTQLLPSVYYKKNRGTYYIAPIIQKQKTNVSGIQLNYEYTLVGEGEAYAKRLELFCFATGIYQNDALMGKHALCNESMANPEFSDNICQMHFKSVEAYAGFGLRIKLFKNVKWVNSLGGGGYTSFNFPCHLYYAGHNLGMILKTGISIDLK